MSSLRPGVPLGSPAGAQAPLLAGAAVPTQPLTHAPLRALRERGGSPQAGMG